MNPIEDYFKIETGTCFILGNGPSLNNYNLSLLDKDKCITMNRSWNVVPGARYHINTMDITSVKEKPQTLLFLAPDESAVGASVLRKIKCPVVLVQTQNVPSKYLKPKKRKLDIPAELDLRNGWPQTHAGLFALGCAWWLGYDTAVLLGYDGYGTHYDGSKMRTELHTLQIKQYKSFAEKLVGRLRIYNCNKDNIYAVHPCIDFDEAVESWH